MGVIIRRFEWDALHRVKQHEGKCRCFHGHRYVADVHLSASQLDTAGRILDFGMFKTILGEWIENNLDHTAILQLGDDDDAAIAIARSNQTLGKAVCLIDDPPTVENIAKLVLETATRLLSAHPVVVEAVRVWETPNCSAIWTRLS